MNTNKRQAEISFSLHLEPDSDADPMEYLFQDDDYKEQDQARLDAWKRDDWCFVGVIAKAEIKIPFGKNEWIVTYMSSPGLWGVESDSSPEYINEVFEEEKDCLKGMLEALRDYRIVEALKV